MPAWFLGFFNYNAIKVCTYLFIFTHYKYALNYYYM